MSISPGEVILIGPHRVICEADLYAVTFIGDVTNDHAQQFHQLNKRYQAHQGYVMCLGDAHRAGTISAETRKLTAQLNRDVSCPGATAIFGGNLIVRTLTTLLLKAISIMMGTASEFAFFKKEPEARAWLAAQRPRLIAQRKNQ